MAQGWLNRCIFTATTGTTADFEVASAVTGYIVPDDAGAVDGDEYHYFAQSDDLSQWEVGTGAYTTTGAVLDRVPILSSNSNALVNFSAAPKVYMGGPLAGDLDGGVTNPLTADLDVGGFEIVGGDDAVGGVAGGPVSITGGDGSDGDGGDILITAGGAETDGTGGAIVLRAGGSASGSAGEVEVYGSDGALDGGAVYFYGGAGLSGNGGKAEFAPGAGTVDGGDVSFVLPAAGTGRQGLIFISGLPSSDPGVPGALYEASGVVMISL